MEKNIFKGKYNKCCQASSYLNAVLVGRQEGKKFVYEYTDRPGKVCPMILVENDRVSRKAFLQIHLFNNLRVEGYDYFELMKKFDF